MVTSCLASELLGGVKEGCGTTMVLIEAWKSSEVSTEFISGRLFAQRCFHHRLQPPPRRPGARHVIIQFMDEKMAEDNRLRTAARFMSAVLNTYCLVPGLP